MKRKTLQAAAIMVTALLTIGPVAAHDGHLAGTDDRVPADAVAQHRERARKANEAAAKQAAAAIVADNRLDLDIRLVGPTSKKVAGDR